MIVRVRLAIARSVASVAPLLKTPVLAIGDLDLGPKKCFVIFDERKIRCRCGYRGVEKLAFVDKYSPYSKRFEEYVSTLCQNRR